MRINIYLTSEEAEKANSSSSSFTPLPEGDYTLSIEDVEQRVSANGRPRLNIRCSVINHPEHNGRVIFYSCPLPWVNNGAVDASGAGFLINLYRGIGKTWTGTEIDTDELIGQVFTAHVVQKPRIRGGVPAVDESGEPIIDNDIKKIYRA